MINREDLFTGNNKIRLIHNLSIPSNVHGYSLGVEYMKYWFLKEFDDNFFKSIYIDGKYIFDDMIQFNKTKLITKEKPMLAIVPSVNAEYDRERLDLELSGRNQLLRRAQYHQYAFLKDYENNHFLGLRLRELEMNFVFKIRVATRAQQLDMLEFMKLAYRVGSTQGESLTMDFHVPYEIMISLATSLGFDIEPDRNGDRYKVKDVQGFLNYLNGHSDVPFLYKYRAVNGNSEYFIKLNGLYTHISNLEAINIDDGEREGMNDNNFHLEMQCILHIPVPHFYYFFTNETLDKRYKLKNDLAGMYSVDLFRIEPPEVNKKNWPQYLSTEYIEDGYEFTTIEFKDLLENGDLLRVMEYSRSSGISPALFMDVIIYNDQKELPIDIDWENFVININRELPDDRLLITIYIDLKYVNESLELLDNMKDSRISKS